jgi:acetyl esterase/lipase
VSTGHRLDPEVAEAIKMLPFDDLTADVLLPLRVRFEMPASDRVERIDRDVPGDPAVAVRVHRPKGAAGVLPCVYSIHGGGYVLGTNLMDDPILDELCPALGIVGVSVEYRLAPETPYPGPLEDCYTGLRWTHEHAEELGIDPDCIGVMGVSAGGGLAAALCLLARERGDLPVAFQLLDQPMLDDRQITPSSRQDGLAVWSRNSNTFG